MVALVNGSRLTVGGGARQGEGRGEACYGLRSAYRAVPAPFRFSVVEYTSQPLPDCGRSDVQQRAWQAPLIHV